MPRKFAFDHQTALTDLRSLGRALDARGTQDQAVPDIDATLAAMKQIHAEIMVNLAEAQRS
ncbi:hypothetical protein E6W39_30785 [Kitasatospora acidiphila]|uniref:Uncharacterized protein n=1 Tax=Kitasatospora acidiphila TaxID=2567942 RepID=A0A540W9X6_9ACTN|nr:hypothetical protein [Kitasatospora acidiphila]TQF05816.1 hypothetical protein E6W39_30785 [Kitasatospora acidiphila]